MSFPPSDEHVTEAITTATEAVTGRREALTTVGIVLPSLSVDLVSCTSFDRPRPLVELGRCGLSTAHALAAALRKAAPR